MIESVGATVANGSQLAAIPIALIAGLLSFASPCVLPLVPGYLGYVGGMAGGSRTGRGRLVGGVALFVAGFTLVFVCFGVVFGTAGLLLKHSVWLDVIVRVAGVIVIVMGLVFIGLFGLMQRTVKPRLKVATGLIGAPLLGVVFALGWTPCLGPTLSAIITTTWGTGGATAARGVTLTVAYCLGLGIPFILVAFGSAWAVRAVSWMRKHTRAIQIFGGITMIVVGVLLVTGVWAEFIDWIREQFVTGTVLPV